jgi:diacylglycerol kinase (ATP)
LLPKGTFLVCNPAAGGGRALAIARGAARDVVLTKARGHATALTTDALRAGYRRIAVAGGDGTVNEVVQSLLACGVALPGSCLLALGGGTSDDFASRVADMTRANDKHMRVREIDVLRIACMTAYGTPSVRYAVNSTSIGLVADATTLWSSRPKAVAHAARISLNAGLLLATAQAITRHRPHALTLAVDNGEPEPLRLSGLIVTKTSRIAGMLRLGIPIAPDDESAAIVTLEASSRGALLSLLPAALTRRVVRHPKIQHRGSATVHLTPDQPLAIEADGEMVGHTPARIDLIPRALPVLLPKRM